MLQTSAAGEKRENLVARDDNVTWLLELSPLGLILPSESEIWFISSEVQNCVVLPLKHGEAPRESQTKTQGRMGEG